MTTSITAKMKSRLLEGQIIACGFLKNAPIFVLAEEFIHYGEQEIKLHNGLILAHFFTKDALYTTGDDGRIVKFDGEIKVIIEKKGQWIDKIAVNGEQITYSIGKKIYFLEKGKEKIIEINSSAGGLAFAPKGLKIGIAHYQGVTLWSPGLIDKTTEFLEWKGSHLGVTFSPDNRFIVSTMQEPQLHGWRLSDKKDMRMSGYPLKVRSFNWTNDGKYLASSGAQEVILWNFEGKNGPMGEKPLMVAPSSNVEAHVSLVASHPKAPVVAAGFSDGMITMARLPDGAEVLVKTPGASSITALCWRSDGKAIAYGCENGETGWGEI